MIDVTCQFLETHFGAFWLVNSFFRSKYVRFFIRICGKLNGYQKKKEIVKVE